MTIIKLSSPGTQHVIKAVTADSILTCLSTSATDVYVAGVTQGSPVHNLGPGDSMLALKGTLSVYLFRRSQDADAFSAEVDLSPSPVHTPSPPVAGAAAAIVEDRPALLGGGRGGGPNAHTGGLKD